MSEAQNDSFQKLFLKMASGFYDAAKSDPKIHQFLVEMVNHLGLKICSNHGECSDCGDDCH